jgi:hypothetical protein
MNSRQEIVLLAMIFFCVTAILFSMDTGIHGKATSTTVSIVNSTPANCSFDVGAGYNIISMPCLTTNSIAGFTSGTQTYAMYQYVPDSPDKWRVYNPNLPSWVANDLQYATRRVGYVVIMNASANVTIEGLNVATTDMPLAAGYNLLGYPAFDTRNASDSFGSIAGFTKAVTYNKSTESFITYPAGGLIYTIPGQGYWINVTASVIWTVSS